MARPRKNKEVENKEIIPTVDVGAEVVEDTVKSVEVINEKLDEMEEVLENIQDISKTFSEALQEDLPSEDTEVSDLGENVSESVTEAIVANNKQTLINGQGNPVPTTQITLRHVNMEKMVADILQVAYIGGDLDPTFYPRLNAVPYLCKMLIPTDMVTVFENKTQLAEYHEDGEVVSVKAFDVINLVKQLIEVGKKGYVLTPKKAVLTRGKFLASVTGRVPIKPSINFNVDVRTLAKYTREELTSFDLATLKGLGERYGVSHRGKVPLIAMILKAQQE
jgi:hypothetical protein